MINLKKLLAGTLSAAMIFTSMALPVFADDNTPTESTESESGTGEDVSIDWTADTIEISTAAGLKAFSVESQSNNFLGKTIVLTDNIDMSSITKWEPIGRQKHFAGTFNGNDKTITGFKSLSDGYTTVNGSTYCNGFFGNINGSAIIKNITFDNATVECTYPSNYGNIFGIVSAYAYGGKFENVHVKNSSIKGFGKIGGILGMAAEPGATTVTNCSVENTEINATTDGGGIIGLGQGKIEMSGCTVKDITFTEDSGEEYETIDVEVACSDGSAASCPGKGTKAKGRYWSGGRQHTANRLAGYYLAGHADFYTHYGNGSHDCVLKDTTNKLGNSEIIYDAVAEINGVKYLTLTDAVAAAQDGDTVTMLDDAEGAGLMLKTNEAKNITIDFNGKTYKATKAVGSSTYETQAAHFEKGNTVTLKNGTLTATDPYANILIQNYSNLTLDNMQLDVPASAKYAISCNYGIAVLNNVNITGGTDNLVALDVMHWKNQRYLDNFDYYAEPPMVTVNNTDANTIKGKMDVYCYDKQVITDCASLARLEITGGTFTTDVSKYVAKGYMSRDNKNGTYTVVKAVATVNDTAKSSGVEVTLDDLHKNDKIELNKDVTYSVVLDTVKAEDKAAVDKIKNDADNAGKTVIAYDIYVEKTEDGVKSEVSGVRDQKVTLKLPTKVAVDSDVKVYHNGSLIDGVITISEDRMSVSFTAPSFSAYTFVYAADALSAGDITKNVEVNFERVTDGEYNIVLKATDGKKINGLLTADLTFALTQGEGIVNYEITPAANMGLVENGSTYTFSFDGTNAHSATGESIVIGKVVFDGYCKDAEFKVAAGLNRLHTTKATNSIVEDYLTDGDGTTTGRLVVDHAVIDLNLTQETKNLTVKVSFPNAIEDQLKAYQDMTVKVSGNGITKEVKLGSDADPAVVAFDDTNKVYTVSFNNTLIKNSNYTVTVSGAGYRTARYTVSMTGDKTLNFWNNVMDAPTFVEEGVGTASQTNFLAGDIVKDGQINIYDLSAVISYFGTDNLVSTHSAYAKYDLNRDGKIDSKDVSYVLVSWGK